MWRRAISIWCCIGGRPNQGGSHTSSANPICLRAGSQVRRSTNMACNRCETNFQGYQSVVVSILQQGANRLVYVQNQGRNIVMIRRILLCYTTVKGGGGML